MKGSLIKTAVVVAVAPVLLYYNVAWAVLRCPHQREHSSHQAFLYDAGLHAVEISLSSPPHRQINLECTGPNYHTEWLAGASASSELLRLTRDITPNLVASSALSHVSRDQADGGWLTALVNQASSPALPICLPLYLSLSVIRF